MPTTHLQRNLSGEYASAVYLAKRTAKRLEVFVHGWKGDTLKTWQGFQPKDLPHNDWWQESDLIFVGYDSVDEEPPAVVRGLLRELEGFYPIPPLSVVRAGGIDARPDPQRPYEELLLVGHSLGGLVIRAALLAELLRWEAERVSDPAAPRPAILSARQRLFSPASGGFRPTGFLNAIAGELTKTMLVRIRLNKGAAWHYMQADSKYLTEIQGETEARQNNTGAEALRARAWWPNPEDVVFPTGYLYDDLHDFATRKTRKHTNICKPDAAHPEPWKFVETGSAR